MINEKELIRRALLGDQQAQKECTEKGIVLPCPHCGSNKINKKYACGDYWYSCEHCKADSGMHGDYRISLSEWNTRPAPPIGKCGECKFYTILGHCEVHSHEPYQYGSGAYVAMLPEDFCSYFEPKGE